MSREVRYRLYFNNEPATREQLDLVESVTVEQEADMAWEARLEIPVCVDRRGRWTGDDAPFMEPSARVRVEVSVAVEDFIPLIDGPVVRLDSGMNFEPGQSTLTVTARDDSHFFNLRDEHFNFDDADDDYGIVSEIFDGFHPIASSEIDDSLREGRSESVPVRSNDTAMKVLLSLARVHDMHAYVLPGENPGESIGCFKPFPAFSDRQAERLPPLILLGTEANIRNLNHRYDRFMASETQAASIRISDKSVISSTGSFRDRELMGDRAALPGSRQGARRILRPNPFEGPRMDQAVASRAQSSSFAFETTGEVIEGCYQGVLRPYRLVTVRAGQTPRSGGYVITRVTHTLNRSSYSQSFTLARNAESETSDKNPLDRMREIF